MPFEFLSNQSGSNVLSYRDLKKLKHDIQSKLRISRLNPENLANIDKLLEEINGYLSNNIKL
jgi:hypothetical protein